MVDKNLESNVYDIKPINDKGLECIVNQQQIQDLKITQEGRRF